MTTSTPHPWGTNLQKAQTFQPDWDSYVVTKVKHVRAALLSGIDTFSAEGFTVPMATGFIELTGMRAGSFRTFLKIGFSESNRVMLPTFQLVDNAAVGTLILPSPCFGSALQFVNSPMAHFRIGGDGRQRNGLFDAIHRDNQGTIFDFHSVLLVRGMGGPLGGPARLHDTGHMTHYTFARRPPKYVREFDAALPTWR